nr:tetratricopeptide repeat protein [Marinobacter sp.]
MLDCTRNAGICLMLLAVAALSGCAATHKGSSYDKAQTQPVPSPEQAEVLAREGRRAYEQGEVESAIQSWQSAVELNPADVVTVNNLALALKDANRFSEAVTLLEKGVNASPETAELHYNLAVISELYLLQLDKALAHYQRYQQLSVTEDKAVAGWIVDLERRLQ